MYTFCNAFVTLFSIYFSFLRQSYLNNSSFSFVLIRYLFPLLFKSLRVKGFLKIKLYITFYQDNSVRHESRIKFKSRPPPLSKAYPRTYYWIIHHAICFISQPLYFSREDSTSLISAFLFLSSFSVEISFCDRNLVVTYHVIRFKSPFCFLSLHPRRHLSSFRKIEHFPKWKFVTDETHSGLRRNVDLTP